MKVNLAENIRAFRKEHGMTQEQLAEAMGVTVGAISKWELNLSTPEIGMIVELADFFETSVDVLLGYNLQKSSMGQALERMKELLREKNYSDLKAEMEKALQKYPNSFSIVRQAAKACTMISGELQEMDLARRAIALHERSLELLAQNTNPQIGRILIQNEIAMLELSLGENKKALQTFQENNIGGTNDGFIGYTLAALEHQPKEAFPYLTDALIRAENDMCRVVLGFASAWHDTGEFKSALKMLEWMLAIERGMNRDDTVVSFGDKAEAIFLLAIIQTQAELKDWEGARKNMRRAKLLAERFDANPQYGLDYMWFYRKEQSGIAFDDIGHNVMEILEKGMQREEGVYNPDLKRIWEEVKNEHNG